MDAIELAHGTTELLPPIGAVIAYNHRALEVLRYDERDGGWIAGGWTPVLNDQLSEPTEERSR